MKNTIKEIKNCTGCGLCAFICPTGAISIVSDENREHFLYPHIDEQKCINCGLCKQKCPAQAKGNKVDRESNVYLYSKNEWSKLKLSSSGGAFQTIAEHFLMKGKTSIYGACWDGLKVIHKRITNIDELKNMLGSKYIQSYVSKDVYAQIKEDLRNNYNVVFSGTPCQVAAVRTFINKNEQERLLLIELLCHGVPSQWAFDKCIEHENKIIKGNIESFAFRHKIAFEKDNRNFLYTFSKNKNMYKTCGTFIFNPFYVAFHSYSIYRKSCYDCNFRNNRFSDIIIGDFWGLSKLLNNVNSNFDKSLMIPLTKKGKEVVESMCTDSNISVGQVDQFNESLFRNSTKNDKFTDFNVCINDFSYYKKLRPNIHLFITKISIKNFVKTLINLVLPKNKKMRHTELIYKVKKIK